MSIEHSILTDRRGRAQSRFMVPLDRMVAGLLTGLLLSTGLLLLARRLAGALEQPLPAAALVAVALLATSAAVAAQWRLMAWQWPAAARLVGSLAWWLPALALLPLALALSLPGSSAAGVTLLWLVPITGEAALGYRRYLARRRTRDPQPADSTDRSPPRRAVQPMMHDHADRDHADVETAVADPDVMQQLTRRQTAEGLDQIEGWLRVSLVAGQRTSYAHVSFCPPFESTPRIEFAQADGPAARIKLGQLLAYGARFEVKLDKVGPADVSIAFTARNALTGSERPNENSAET